MKTEDPVDHCLSGADYCLMAHGANSDDRNELRLNANLRRQLRKNIMLKVNLPP